ncbi:hypothetical protein B0O99DRAFT_624728 [Bisporella sp. PMI_857]|nr:hypothetical protein B0O99DRAFT_624728 [Bisporella sp. PMI_857]
MDQAVGPASGSRLKPITFVCNIQGKWKRLTCRYPKIQYCSATPSFILHKAVVTSLEPQESSPSGLGEMMTRYLERFFANPTPWCMGPRTSQVHPRPFSLLHGFCIDMFQAMLPQAHAPVSYIPRYGSCYLMLTGPVTSDSAW